MNKRRVVSLLAAGAGLFGVGERLMSGSVIEGPQHRSEVFYVSMNHYPSDGSKHDDRLGDVAIFITVAGLAGLASRDKQRKMPNEMVDTGNLDPVV